MVSRLPEKEKTMKCMYCQGQMKKGTAPFHIDRQGYHLTLDAVPAWVCQQCGEVYFDEKEVASIQDIIKAVEDRKKRLIVAA
jgi:YgiT-type zinc finger domain-containing protein